MIDNPEDYKTLGRIEACVAQNAESVEKVIRRLDKLTDSVEGLHTKINDTDTDLRVLQARGKGFLAAVGIFATLLVSAFSEKITQIKHFIFG